MDHADEQKRQFQDRLARMQSRDGIALQVGGETVIVPGKARKSNSKSKELAGNSAYPLAIVGAFIIGYLTVALARYLQSSFVDDTYGAENAETTMVVEALLAMAIGFIFKNLIHYKGQEFTAANTVGVIVAIATFHNFVHMAPDLFRKFYGPTWTEMVLTYTEPSSLRYGSNSIKLGGGASASTPEMPTILELDNTDR